MLLTSMKVSTLSKNQSNSTFVNEKKRRFTDDDQLKEVNLDKLKLKSKSNQKLVPITAAKTR
jgi:hypothetical protein